MIATFTAPGIPYEEDGTTYTLRIGDANNESAGTEIPVNGQPGDIALGGLYVGSLGPVDVANTVIVIQSSVEVLTGDAGAIHADSTLIDTDVVVDTGNLNDVDAADIGIKTAGGNINNGYGLTDPMLISVPVGGIGLLRNTDSNPLTGTLFVEPLNMDQNVLDPVTHAPYIAEPGRHHYSGCRRGIVSGLRLGGE